MNLELAPEQPKERSCRLCGQAIADRICVQCGVDVETGELVAPPQDPERPERDGTRPERRAAAAALLAIPTSTREVFERGLYHAVQGWAGTLACLLGVAFALSFRTVGAQHVPWPGQLGATFILSFLLVEHARASHEGGGERVLGGSGAFDPSSLGPSLLTAVAVFPLLAGPLATDPTLGVVFGIPFALALPALLGALVCGTFAELAPSRIKAAIAESPNYLRTAFLVTTLLAIAMAVVWLPSAQSPIWRAPIAAFATTIAGVLIGLMRLDGESQVEE